MFRTIPLSIISSFSLYTQQWYMSYRFADSMWAISGWNQFCTDPARKLYDIYHCCVYSGKTLDDGQRNCLNHVEFYSKNKSEKLVCLVGFIIRINHDARSAERQTRFISYRSNTSVSLSGTHITRTLPALHVTLFYIWSRWPGEGQVTETWRHQGKNETPYCCWADWNGKLLCCLLIW